MAEFFDTHAHLDFPDFRDDLPAVIDRAQEAGITRLLAVGTTLASSRRTLELADRYPGVFAIVGVHPNHAHEEPEEILPVLQELVRHPKVVALGETGLDYYRLDGLSPVQVEERKTRQKSAFEQHLRLAAETGMNCVIHQRDSFPETLRMLAPWAGRLRGVFHCFTGTPAEAAEALALGSLVSFTGIATFRSAGNLREVVAGLPPDRFMLETDCPFLAPVPYRGQRCEPAYVRELARCLAEVRGIALEDLSRATCATARAFFPRLA